MFLYKVDKLVPNSINFIRGLVKYVPGRGYFRDVPFQNGDRFATPPPPAPDCLTTHAADHSVSIREKRSRTHMSTCVFRCGKGGDIQMSTYVDADHATCIESQRSVSGGAILLAGASII